MAVLPKPKLIVYIGWSQKSFEPEPNPKNSPKGPKKVQKRPKMWSNLKQKVTAVLTKLKLIVYIGRSQKSIQTGPQTEKKPFHFSIFNSEFFNSEFSNFKRSNSEL